MPSFNSCLMHGVFSVKDRCPLLTAAIRERLWPYLGGIARENNIKALAIGGVANYAHLHGNSAAVKRDSGRESANANTPLNYPREWGSILDLILSRNARIQASDRPIQSISGWSAANHLRDWRFRLITGQQYLPSPLDLRARSSVVTNVSENWPFAHDCLQSNEFLQSDQLSVQKSALGNQRTRGDRKRKMLEISNLQTMRFINDYFWPKNTLRLFTALRGKKSG